jgi:hypothetical protein
MLVPHLVFKIKCNKFAMMALQSTLRYDDAPTEIFGHSIIIIIINIKYIYLHEFLASARAVSFIILPTRGMTFPGSWSRLIYDSSSCESNLEERLSVKFT